MAKRATTKAVTRGKASSAAAPATMTMDSFVNLLTGMGTDKDKLKNTRWSFTPLEKPQLDSAYRGDWISRKIVDIPAYDSFREWRTWDLDPKDADLVIEQEKVLKLQRKCMLAETRGRLYGGGALVLGVDQGKSDEELNFDSLDKGCLKFVHSVTRYELAAGTMNRDIMSPYYGEPEYYTITSLVANGQTESLRFHPSRVIRFTGLESIDPTLDNGWGDPVLSIVADAVLSAGTVNTSIAQLVAETKVDIMKIPGFANNITTAAYETRLRTKIATANAMKSLYNVLVMDAAEEWERINASFDTLPDIAKFYMLMACGAADIPATRFLGQSPAGLNATGESDIRNYYDSRKTDQTLRIQPTLERLDKVLLISSLGKYEDSITYQWCPLWQLSDAEKADIATKKATTFKADVDAGLLNDVVLKKAREAQLIQDDTYPGLSDIIEEYDDDPELENKPDPSLVPPMPGNENDPNVQNNTNAKDPKAGVDPASGEPTPSAGKGKAVKAADLKAVLGDKMVQPKPLYVYRDVLNKNDIIAWAKEQGFDSIVSDLHVTVVYCKKAVDWLKAGDDTFGYGNNEDGTIVIPPGGPRVVQLFGQNENVAVLAFASSNLAYRNSSIMYRIEGESDFDDYTPHISITYNVPSGMKVDGVEPYRGVIVLGPEIFTEIDVTFNNATDVIEEDL